ncbi:MAG TPA: hypothetical protein VJZ27_17995, partial [Aggregatilineales bacterium]|nr:hypothetical protein [Aggregatilineales bacterium]
MAEQQQALFLLHPGNLQYLKKQIPRPAFPESGKYSLIAFGIIFFTSLIIFLVIAVPPWKRQLDLKRSGVDTVGYVSGIGFEERDVEWMNVRYTFEANGQTYEDEQRVDLDDTPALVQVDENLPIRYVRGNPEVSEISGFDYNASFRTGATIGGVIWLSIWLIALIFHIERYDQNSQLASKGTTIKGVVVECVGNKPERDSGIFQAVQIFFSGWFWVMRRREQSQFTVYLRYKFTSPESGKE